MTNRPIADIVAEMRAKMEGVTPGPWSAMPSVKEAWYGLGDRRTVLDGGGYIYLLADWTHGEAEHQFLRFKDCSYLAACDPDTIRAVLDALEAAQQEIARLSKERRLFSDALLERTIDIQVTELDSLSAQLAAVTKERDEAQRNIRHKLCDLTEQVSKARYEVGIAVYNEQKSLEIISAERDAALRNLAEAVEFIEAYAEDGWRQLESHQWSQRARAILARIRKAEGA